MKRRQFLGGVAGGALTGLSGCVSNVPSGFLQSLVKSNTNYDTLRKKLQNTYQFDPDQIYLNEFIGALQIKGSKGRLERVVTSLPLESYKIYSTTEFIPVIPDREISNPKINNLIANNLSQTNQFKKVASVSSFGESSRVGMIDTKAYWDTWNSGKNPNQLSVAQNMNPILGPILRDKDHGLLTARTLFDETTTISITELHRTIRGIVSNATPFHAEISALTLVPQFFRSLCESLEWFGKNNVDVIVIPLSIAKSDKIILTKIIERFVHSLSSSIVIVSAGNVDPCSSVINALGNTDSDYIIGTGSISQSGSNYSLTGNLDIADIFTIPSFAITHQLSYTGTSASTTILGGIISNYFSILRTKYPNYSPKEYRDAIIHGLYQSTKSIPLTRCGSEYTIDQLQPWSGIHMIERELTKNTQ